MKLHIRERPSTVPIFIFMTLVLGSALYMLSGLSVTSAELGVYGYYFLVVAFLIIILQHKLEV
jgi:uncharacterized membrane protein YiaA